MHRIVVSDGKLPDDIEDMFGDSEVSRCRLRTPSEVIEACSGADGLIVDASTPVGEKVLWNLELEVVGRSGTGIDNVDLEAAKKRGTKVVNVPDYCTEEVSTTAVALFLGCIRRVSCYSSSTRDGEWSWRVGRPIHRLKGDTVGLYSFGDIARRTAEKLAGFGVDIVAFDPYVSENIFQRYGVSSVGFSEMIGESDHLLIHAPLTDETQDSIGIDELRGLSDRGVVVNTGRGGIVDEEGLVEALDAGEIAAAGLDVMAEEPPKDSTLVDRSDTVVTPHAGWYSESSLDELTRKIASDVSAVLEGGKPDSLVC